MNRNFVWRGDGRLEVVCSHGVGHTVSALVPGKSGIETREVYYEHGCDGCCHEDELIGRLLRPIKELAAVKYQLEQVKKLVDPAWSAELRRILSE